MARRARSGLRQQHVLPRWAGIAFMMFGGLLVVVVILTMWRAGKASATPLQTSAGISAADSSVFAPDPSPGTLPPPAGSPDQGNVTGTAQASQTTPSGETAPRSLPDSAGPDPSASGAVSPAPYPEVGPLPPGSLSPSGPSGEADPPVPDPQPPSPTWNGGSAKEGLTVSGSDPGTGGSGTDAPTSLYPPGHSPRPGGLTPGPAGRHDAPDTSLANVAAPSSHGAGAGPTSLSKAPLVAHAAGMTPGPTASASGQGLLPHYSKPFRTRDAPVSCMARTPVCPVSLLSSSDSAGAGSGSSSGGLSGAIGSWRDPLSASRSGLVRLIEAQVHSISLLLLLQRPG
jgi:hypothetical protein